MIRLLPRTTTLTRTRMTIALNGTRALSSRASGVLSALGLSTDAPIPGVYDGKWGGSGPLVESHCPTTGEVIARVQTVSLLPDPSPALALLPLFYPFAGPLFKATICW